MGKLHYGIHRGTLMSRDVANPIEVDSKESAKVKANELDEYFAKMGYKLWFAHYREIPGKDYVAVHEGNSYER